MSFAAFSPDSWLFKVGVIFLLAGALYGVKFRWHPTQVWAQNIQRHLHEGLETMTLVLAALFFFIQPFVAQAWEIPSSSMENTLPVGDRVLSSPLAPRLLGIKAGEVLVFRAPQIALTLAGGLDNSGPYWIKRCIGAAGDRIEIKKRVLYRNGKIVGEPYTNWGPNGYTYDMKIVGQAIYSREYDSNGIPSPWMQAYIAAPVNMQATITNTPTGAVPAGRLLMLGDHRDASLDGHIWGFLKQDEVVGRAFGVFWPPSQMGTIQSK